MEVPDYTTFQAQFAVTEGDIVFHFFKSDEVKARRDAQEYWVQVFPTALQPVALEHFNTSADSGRLKAQYIFLDESPYSVKEPLDSWWLRAYSYGQLLDPHRSALRFLEKLDHALEEATKSK